MSTVTTPQPIDRWQVRRAWLVLSVATLCFLMLAATAAAGARYVYIHATQAQSASVQIVSGSAALFKRADDPNWRLIDESTDIREGDEISTALGTVLQVTMFDGSIVEVSEDTLIRIDRMRSSRFLNRTKESVLTLRSGTVHVQMEQVGEHRYAEFVVRAFGVDVVMSDEPSRREAGVFLVEVTRDSGDTTMAASVPAPVRTAVLEGAAMVTTERTETKLHADQQVMIKADGTFSEVTPPFRQLIANGSFAFGFANWTEFRRSSVLGADPTGAEIELVRDSTAPGPSAALRLSRPVGFNVPVTVGVRQRIGQTVQPSAPMEFRMDVKVDAQNPPGGGDQARMFPIAFTLHYVDIDGEDRELTRGYYAFDDGAPPVPANSGAKVPAGSWQRIVLDLNDLTPAARQIDSILVYASGVSFDASVANISLTTRERLTGAK